MLLFNCTKFQHEHSFNVALLSIDLNNDTLHLKAPKHVTNSILHPQKIMGKKKRKLHLKLDKEKNLGKENKGKLYPGILTDLNVRHILHKYCLHV